MNASPHASRPHTRTVDVATLGESMLTIRPEFGRDAFEWEVCGAESNVARYCASLGLHAAWVSQVGADMAGDLVVSALRDAGVEVSGVQRVSGRQTGLMVKEVNASERRVHYYRRDSAAAAMDHNMDLGPARDAHMLHLTGITMGLSSTCHDLVQSLITNRTHTSLVSFDVNWRPAIWADRDGANILRTAANECDLVFVGLDEAQDLWGATTVQSVRAFLPQPRTLVVKDGGKGAFADIGGTSHHVPALQGPVIEPVGAGDAFAAGVLAGQRRFGDDAESWLRLGHITAMSAIAQPNDVGPVADDKTTDALLRLSPAEWASARLDLSSPAAPAADVGMA